MSAVSVSISIDDLEDISAHPHVSKYDGRTLAFLDFGGASIFGRNPEMFRRLASRCSEAAAILEAANVAFPLRTADEIRAEQSDESGVA